MFAGAIKGAARSFGAGESVRRAVNKGGLVPGGHQDHRQVPTGRRQLAEGVPWGGHHEASGPPPHNQVVPGEWSGPLFRSRCEVRARPCTSSLTPPSTWLALTPASADDVTRRRLATAFVVAVHGVVSHSSDTLMPDFEESTRRWKSLRIRRAIQPISSLLIYRRPGSYRGEQIKFIVLKVYHEHCFSRAFISDAMTGWGRTKVRSIFKAPDRLIRIEKAVNVSRGKNKTFLLYDIVLAGTIFKRWFVDVYFYTWPDGGHDHKIQLF